MQAEVLVGSMRSKRGTGWNGTQAEETEEQTQRNPDGICSEATSQQPAGRTHVLCLAHRCFKIL